MNDKGWQTSEFYVTIGGQLLAVLALVGIVPTGDVDRLTAILIKGVTSAFGLAAAGVMGWRYIQARTDKKVAEIEASASVTEAVETAKIAAGLPSTPLAQLPQNMSSAPPPPAAHRSLLPVALLVLLLTSGLATAQSQWCCQHPFNVPAEMKSCQESVVMDADTFCPDCQWECFSAPSDKASVPSVAHLFRLCFPSAVFRAAVSKAFLAATARVPDVVVNPPNRMLAGRLISHVSVKIGERLFPLSADRYASAPVVRIPGRVLVVASGEHVGPRGVLFGCPAFVGLPVFISSTTVIRAPMPATLLLGVSQIDSCALSRVAAIAATEPICQPVEEAHEFNYFKAAKTLAGQILLWANAVGKVLASHDLFLSQEGVVVVRADRTLATSGQSASLYPTKGGGQ